MNYDGKIFYNIGPRRIYWSDVSILEAGKRIRSHIHNISFSSW